MDQGIGNEGKGKAERNKRKMILNQPTSPPGELFWKNEQILLPLASSNDGLGKLELGWNGANELAGCGPFESKSLVVVRLDAWGRGSGGNRRR
jgi:hypothetical protein